MDFWTLTGVAAIVAGLILAIRYGLRAYKHYTYTDPVDTLPEAKAVALDVGKAAFGGLILGIGIKLIIGAFLLLMVFVVAPAHARAAIIICDQQGCRQTAAPGPIVTHPKIIRNIAMRPNVEASRPRKLYRKAVIRRGLWGEFLSPMHDYRAPLEACGYRVEYASFWNSASGADVEITHSMATFGALNSDSKRVFTIDAPIWAGGFGLKARHPRTANFPTAAHPRVYGAVNVPIRGGHIGAPTQAKPYILSMLGCGKARRSVR